MSKKTKYKGPKVVVIGGGTGSSVILRGLKKYTSNITAIVTVADDGGSSGILRKDLGMLPPGDIRSCILALADTEPTMEKLFQYRFQEGSLKGQNFGNLFIAAMNEITGNFEEAIRKISDVLKVKGTVLPVTLDDIVLLGELENGEFVEGESQIPIVAKQKGQRIKKISIHPPKAAPLKYAIEAINAADAIILGPGSLYTSIIPNLLVDDLPNIISRTDAIKIYIPNIMTQPGETDFYNVMDHLGALLEHAGETENPFIEWVIANSGNVPEYLQEKYQRDGARRVVLNPDDIEKYPYDFIIGDFLEVKEHYIRHNADKLSQVIFQLIMDKKLSKDETRRKEYEYLKGLLEGKENSLS